MGALYTSSFLTSKMAHAYNASSSLALAGARGKSPHLSTTKKMIMIFFLTLGLTAVRSMNDVNRYVVRDLIKVFEEDLNNPANKDEAFDDFIGYFSSQSIDTNTITQLLDDR